MTFQKRKLWSACLNIIYETSRKLCVPSWQHTLLHMSQRWKESLLDVFNESLSSFSSFHFITNSSRFARERECAWAASLAWSSSIYYTGRKGCFPSSKLTHKHTQTRTNTEGEKHTLHSLAGRLTLSGDEVVGSMVALKESRRMTCWVSRRCAPQAQLCKRGVVRPIFNPPPQVCSPSTDPLCKCGPGFLHNSWSVWPIAEYRPCLYPLLLRVWSRWAPPLWTADEFLRKWFRKVSRASWLNTAGILLTL